MFKKLLPLLLILCLMLTSCTTPVETTGTTAAGGDNIGENNNNNENNENNDPTPDPTPVIDVAGVEKDPLGAIDDATEKTEPVIQDDAQIIEIITGALTEGTTTVTLSSPELLAMMGLSAPVSATLKSDIANGKLHLSAPNFLDAEDPSALIDLYLDGSKLGVQSEALFGFAGTYFADLSDEEKLSAFVEMLTALFTGDSGDSEGTDIAPLNETSDSDITVDELPAEGETGFDPAIIEMYIQQLEAILATLEGYELDMEAIEAAVLGNLTPVVKAEDVKIGDTTVKCIGVTYTIDIDTICDIATDVFAEIEIPAALLDELNSMLGSAMTEEEIRTMVAETIEQVRVQLKEEMAPTIVVKTLINAFTGKLHGIDLSINATLSSDEYDYETDETISVTRDTTMTVEVLYADAGREITFSLKDGETLTSMKASLYRKVNDCDVTYTASLEVLVEGDSVKLEIPMVYNTETGVITVTLKMTADNETQMIILTGSAKAEGNTATFTVDTIAVEEQTLNIGLALTFTKGLDAAISIPADATDITTLTEDEIMELLAQMENGLIFQLIGGSQGELVGLIPDGTYSYTNEGGLTMSYVFEGSMLDVYMGSTWLSTAYYEIDGDQIIVYPITDGEISDEGDPNFFEMGDGYIIIGGLTFVRVSDFIE